MKRKNLTSSFLLFASITVGISLLIFSYRATSQTRERTVNANLNSGLNGPADPAAARAPQEVVKVDVDLVKVDALVLQKDTARIVGDLKKEDFQIYEDGMRQEITHFSQDNLPLSVILLIDRGGCLDPFGDEVHRAAREAIDRLKIGDEVAVMSYHSTTTMVQRFTRNRMLIGEALNRIPPHEEEAGHCLNKAMSDAAAYMIDAANPVGRRVVIVITGVTRSFDCLDGPSGKSAARAIFESGAVVCGLIPKDPLQGLENGVMIWATRMGKVGRAPYTDLQTLANETGGEILSEKAGKLETTFEALIDHLRSRYNLAFVSTNKNRDGSTRKLKLEVTAPNQSAKTKLVVKARRTYVAPKG
jgi:Ca-activated chloride channel family protein